VEVILTYDTYSGWGGGGGKAKCDRKEKPSKTKSKSKDPWNPPHISETADQHWLDFNFAQIPLSHMKMRIKRTRKKEKCGFLGVCHQVAFHSK